MPQTLATISSPEFINLQPVDINPLMSKCEIKVLYTGGNRNGSYITKEVATDMAKTLRGAPIVGYYKEDAKDFGDHGDQMIFDGDGIHFNCLTKPYGFVAPDSPVWFQKFEEQNSFGEIIEREYLMTVGYLWTGQFEEVQSVIDKGKGQSMELDPDSLQGSWEVNSEGIEFFIINDAIFSKLCILGDDVEPCFEGANVTAPEVSKNFSLDDNFKQTLYSMIQDMNTVIKGGQKNMEDKKDILVDFTNEEDTEEKKDTTTEEKEPEDKMAKTKEEEKGPEDKMAKTEEEEKEDKKEEEKEDDSDSKEEEEEDKKKDYSLMEKEYEELKTKFALLEEKCEELEQFKASIDKQKKQDMIDSFYMLSDEDKKEVVENIDTYSLEEIEAKLSVICVRKKVDFNLEDEKTDTEEKEDDAITTFNLDNSETFVPAWLKAVDNYNAE